MRCEDYPCCGHTDGLGCNWTAPDYSNDPHLMCDHAAGVCDAEPDDYDHDLDYDDRNDAGTPWCYGCDAYAECDWTEPDWEFTGRDYEPDERGEHDPTL